jgi:hypothetical protein
VGPEPVWYLKNIGGVHAENNGYCFARVIIVLARAYVRRLVNNARENNNA